LGRLLHDFAIDQYQQGNRDSAHSDLEKAYKHFVRGYEYAQKTREILEKLENLTELAFLVNDAIVIYGQGKVPTYYQGALPALENALYTFDDGRPRTHRYPVFEALLKLARGDVAFTNGEYDQALTCYLDGYKELGTSQGYGVARYRQHFHDLVRRIERLPADQQAHWCREFVKIWKETPSGRGDKTLADDLTPDLVRWCNRLLMKMGGNN
jgi:tetratricopeptide (TPR) repeat protein